MASDRRLQKLNNLLREEISKILDGEIEFPEESLVTVTRVETSPDIHYATVFVSIFGGEEKQVLEILTKNVYNIQQILNRKLRMRPVPKIHFEIDEGELQREKVEKSLAGLKIKGEF